MLGLFLGRLNRLLFLRHRRDGGDQRQPGRGGGRSFQRAADVFHVTDGPLAARLQASADVFPIDGQPRILHSGDRAGKAAGTGVVVDQCQAPQIGVIGGLAGVHAGDVAQDTPGLLAVGLQAVSKDFHTVVRLRNVDAGGAVGTGSVDLVDQRAAQNTLLFGFQVAPTQVAVGLIEHQGAELVEEIGVPQQDRVGAVFGELAQPGLAVGAEDAGPNLTFAGEDVLEQLSGQPGVLRSLPDFLVEAVLPFDQGGAGRLNAAGRGHVHALQAAIQTGGGIHHAILNERAGQVVIPYIGLQLGRVCGRRKPFGQPAQLGEGLPGFGAGSDFGAHPLAAEHVHVPRAGLVGGGFGIHKVAPGHQANFGGVMLAGVAVAGIAPKFHVHAVGVGGGQRQPALVPRALERFSI